MEDLMTVTADMIPWFVGGGADHSPEVARGQLYDSTGGAEGISSGASLKVLAQTPTGGGVRVLPGGCLILSRYPGPGLQTYSARWFSQQLVPLPATPSSSGRTDLIVARIFDPQYEGGQPPADPNNFEYRRLEVIQNVSPTIESFDELNRNYPAIALARVTRPAGRDDVQASHITDLRQVHTPNSLRRVFAHNLSGTTVHELTNGTEQFWPDLPDLPWEIRIPKWATRAVIVASWNSVRLGRSDASGTVWARIGRPDGWGEGNVRTQDLKWDADASGDPADELREFWETSDTVSIPAAMRGTVQPLRLLGRRLVLGSPPRLVNNSAIKFDVEFLEGAD